VDDLFVRLWQDILARIAGPLSLRLVLQPSLAVILAVRDGIADARASRPAYFWAVFADAGHRRQLLREGWKAVAKVFVMAVILDTVFQLVALRWFYPGEATLTAAVLAFVPYLLARGPVNRIVSAARARAARSRAR
jgi:hypothetical protein